MGNLGFVPNYDDAHDNYASYFDIYGGSYNKKRNSNDNGNNKRTNNRNNRDNNNSNNNNSNNRDSEPIDLAAFGLSEAEINAQKYAMQQLEKQREKNTMGKAQEKPSRFRQFLRSAFGTEVPDIQNELERMEELERRRHQRVIDEQLHNNV